MKIETNEQYEAALKEIERVFDLPEEEPMPPWFSELIDEVELYENKNFPIEKPEEPTPTPIVGIPVISRPISEGTLIAWKHLMARVVQDTGNTLIVKECTTGKEEEWDFTLSGVSCVIVPS